MARGSRQGEHVFNAFGNLAIELAEELIGILVVRIRL